MAKQTIGEFLSTLRKAKGYTQQEVADNLCVSNRTVSAWECGNALPDILLLLDIAELYGVTTDEILKGERNKPEALPSPSPEKADFSVESSAKNGEKLKKTFIITAESLAIAAAAISLIFAFFIGVESVTALTRSSYNLFYYFGDCYKDTEKFLQEYRMFNYALYKDYYPLLKKSEYADNIFGTVISAGGIAAVAALATLTVVRALRRLAGKTEKSAAGLAAGTFFTFFAMATAFYALHAGRLEHSGFLYNDIGYGRIQLNTATVAGIILGGISVAVASGFAFVAKEKRNSKLQILRAALCLCSVSFGIVTLGMAEFPVFNIDLYGVSTSFNGKISVGALLLYSFAINGVNPYDYIKKDYAKYIDYAQPFSKYAILSYAFLAATLILIGLAAAVSLKAFSEKRYRITDIIPAALAAICGALFLTFSVFTVENAEKFFPVFARIRAIDYWSAIVIATLSFIPIIIGVVQLCLPRRKTESSDNT